MKHVFAASVLSVVITMTPVSAHATISFQLGNHPQPDEESIRMVGGDLGPTALGVGNLTNTVVRFSSTTDNLNVPVECCEAGRIEGRGGDELNNITISVPGGSYTDLIFNTFNGPINEPEGVQAVVTVNAIEPDGGQSTFTTTYTLGRGDNFLTILASDGEVIASTTVDVFLGFHDLRETRISGAFGDTPEPGIALLLASALGAIALYIAAGRGGEA